MHIYVLSSAILKVRYIIKSYPRNVENICFSARPTERPPTLASWETNVIIVCCIVVAALVVAVVILCWVYRRKSMELVSMDLLHLNNVIVKTVL